MSGNSTLLLRKMSLRRAIWRARMAAKTVRDQASLDAPERSATNLLRSSVKQQLRTQPLDGFVSGVYEVEDEWRLAVLKRDPHVVQVDNVSDLLLALEGDEPAEVLATRETHLTRDDLRDLVPAHLLHKTVFVES